MPVSGSRATSNRSSNQAEAGTGVVGTLAGVAVFLALLLFAVHLVLNLYGSSVVTAAAFDAARLRAGDGGRAATETDAERHAVGLAVPIGVGIAPGQLQAPVALVAAEQLEGVALRVVAEHPTTLARRARVPFQRVDRTVTVRLERMR
jgi:hypothetical protein